MLGPEELLLLFLHGLRAPERSRHRKGEDLRLRSRAEALGDALLIVLRTRGLAMTAEQEAQVHGCQDVGLLTRWLEQASLIPAAAALFAGR